MSVPVRETEIAVIGGGLVGAAIGWGLARLGRKAVVLDEGDTAFRASRGNFALVWVQSKGLGMPEYAAWTRKSADRWSGLAEALKTQTGLDVAFQRPGGLTLCLSDHELQHRADTIRRLHNQAGSGLPYEILDHEAARRLEPRIGPDVAGAIYCPLDGHANALRLLRAFHAGLAGFGATYLPEHRVRAISAAAKGFVVETPASTIRCEKVVLAAGLDNARLAPMVGVSAPVRPQKGEVMVTERLPPLLHHPVVNVRQTDEGSVLVGDSQEEAGLDTSVIPGVLATMAERAVRLFPALAGARVVRSWAALRVMSPDGFPIYDTSTEAPGAWLVTCHSGVTLAAAHALELAPHIAAGRLPEEFAAFGAKRFDVPHAA